MSDNTSQNNNNLDTFDIVIVGCGPSAIGLLLGLLHPFASPSPSLDNTKISCPRIAIIERGSEPHDPKNNTTHLQSWYRASHNPSSSSSSSSSSVKLYPTTPQRGLFNNRILDVPVGKGLGGGTLVNAGLVCLPDFDQDFVNWPGCWDESMKKGVDFVLDMMKQNDMLGWSVPERKRVVDDEDDEMPSGTPSKFPSFSSRVTVAARRQTTRHEGGKGDTSIQRVDYHTGLVVPFFESNPHLKEYVTYFQGVEAQQILFEKNDDDNDKECLVHAVGVECIRVPKDGDKEAPPFAIKANKELVLCCGAILSPSLLQVSGIGPLSVLQKAGIDPLFPPSSSVSRHDGVGQNLKDHTILPRLFFTPRNIFGQSVNCVMALQNAEVSIPQPFSSNNHQNGGKNSTVRRVQFQLNDMVILKDIFPDAISSLFRTSLIKQHQQHHQQKQKHSWIDQQTFIIITIIDSLLTIFHKITKIATTILVSLPVVGSIIRASLGINISLLDPKSSGSVTILPKSSSLSTSTTLAKGENNHDDTTKKHTSSSSSSRRGLRHFDIIVDPAYLTDESDLLALQTGWNEVGNAIRDEWMSFSLFGIRTSFEYLPGPLMKPLLLYPLSFWLPSSSMKGSEVNRWFRAYAKMLLCPYFHWCGTCAMGEEKKGNDDNNKFVVDETLRVRGVKGLRVCDASVFPDCVSCPTSLTCAGLGYAAASHVVSR